MRVVTKAILALIAILSLAFVTAFVFVPHAPAAEPEEVKMPQALVEVWTMPGCSPCEWVKANAVPKWRKSSKVFVIDYTRWGTAAQRKGITAYPTIIVYTPDKKEVGRYTSGRPYSGDALTRAIQDLINKVNRDVLNGSKKLVACSEGVDAVLGGGDKNVSSKEAQSSGNDISFDPPAGAINECEEGACRIGGLLDWSDGDDEPLEEDDSKSGSADKDRGKGILQGPISNPNSDGTALFAKPLNAIQEKIDELKAEVKSSVMQAAIIGSLIAMVIYAILRTIFSGVFTLAKTIVIKIRNWICRGISNVATSIASKVAEQQAKK